MRVSKPRSFGHTRGHASVPPRELAELARLIEDGKLEPVIDRVFPFAEIGEAFAYLEAGRAKGKVVVRMQDAASDGARGA